MGCQTKIAEAIIAGGGDYILAVKDNQETLHRGIEDFFLDHMSDDFARTEVTRHETIEHGHGREEHRTYYVCDVPAGLPDAKRWKGLVRIGMAVSETVRGGKPSDAVRYYILSPRLSARRFGPLVRGHWGIENRLHWVRDVTMGEDENRTRVGSGPQVLAACRNAAISHMRALGSTNIAASLRRNAARVGDLLKVLYSLKN